MDRKKRNDGFPQRLRALRTSEKMTQKEVARQLGIGQSAVANYEQGLRFPDEKTLKGISALFGVSIDFLLGNTGTSLSGASGSGFSPADLPRQYLDLLLDHRSREALELVTGALAGGAPLEYLLAGVLIPALKATGDLWEDGTIGVAEEHVLSEEVERTAGVLSFLAPKAPGLDARCVCASAGAEMHSIGTRMVSDLLAAAGWQTVFLGIQTPTPDILKLCEAVHADLLILSATMDSHIDAVKNIVIAVRSRPALARCGILVGGGAFVRNPDAWKNVGADIFAGDIPEALRAAEAFRKARRGATS